MGNQKITGKWLLIGHRGAGKSSFLNKLRPRFEVCLDLDEEIEKRTHKKITEIFEKYGEPAFRQSEAATFTKVLEENAETTSIVIALGAGFKGHIWPRDFKCLWLRKDSDIWPRYFKDRPQVGTSDPDSFLSAYVEREERYQSWSDLAWTLEEGFSRVESSEATLWPEDFNFDDSACLTLVPRLHRNPLESIELRKRWNLRFELRTDQWPKNTIKKVLEIAETRFLFSVRNKGFVLSDVFKGGLNVSENILIDWDVSFGDPYFKPDILSLHDFSDGLKQGLAKLEKYSKTYPQALLKASPQIENFFDAELLWQWRERDSEMRMIFPRTKPTRELPLWQWLRLLLKGKQKINFLREATEGLKDQPTLHQYAAHTVGVNFAAIVGNPVMHSYSPYFHKEFFQEMKMPFLAIPLEEIGKASLNFLEKLGAQAFAVTSPLKEHQELLNFSTAGEAGAEKTLNTLVKEEGMWKRYNTDLISIHEIIKKHDPSTSWKIWGAGAVAKQFFENLKNAELYSARSGECLQKKGELAESFNILWAAGDEAARPQFAKAQKVLDLSYNEKSAANLYAIQENLDYECGIDFFRLQAFAQQEIWAEQQEIWAEQL